MDTQVEEDLALIAKLENQFAKAELVVEQSQGAKDISAAITELVNRPPQSTTMDDTKRVLRTAREIGILAARNLAAALVKDTMAKLTLADARRKAKDMVASWKDEAEKLR
jgi:hypothetical protein